MLYCEVAGLWTKPKEQIEAENAAAEEESDEYEAEDEAILAESNDSRARFGFDHNLVNVRPLPRGQFVRNVCPRCRIGERDTHLNLWIGEVDLGEMSGPIPPDEPPPPLPPINLPPALPPGPPRRHGVLAKNSANFKALKTHQKLAITNIQDWLIDPAVPRPASYIEMPTGSGKTLTAVNALAGIVEGGLPVLWIAHNAYLLEQARKAFVERFGTAVESRIANFSGAAKPFGAQITLATVQTLASSDLKHLVDLVKNNRPAIAIFDEFHRSAADTWKHVVDWLKGSAVPVLGLSATPTRSGDAKREWLKRAFPAELFRVGITELIDDRILARPRIFRIGVEGKKLRWTPDEIAHYKTFHDVPESLLKRLATQEKRNKLIVKTLLERKDLNQTIVFCCGVDHAAHLAKRFEKNGISASAVTGAAATPGNAAAIEAFRNKEVRVLTSVVLLTEGVDLPTCDSVLLARPTQSEILLKQMMGRAMRGPNMGGHEECTIIDFVDAFANVKLRKPGWIDVVNAYHPAKPPTIDEQTLVRLRDWIAEQFPEGGGSWQLLLEEIFGVIEFFDGNAGINRVVLVPNKDRAGVVAAVEEVAKRFQASPEKASDPVSAAVETRAAYSKHLSESRVVEEDFVSLVSVASRKEKIELKPVEGRLRELAEAVDALPPEVKMNEGLVELIAMLKGGAIEQGGVTVEPKPGPAPPAFQILGKGSLKQQDGASFIGSHRGREFSAVIKNRLLLVGQLPEFGFRSLSAAAAHITEHATNGKLFWQPATGPKPAQAAAGGALQKAKQPTARAAGHSDGEFHYGSATYRVQDGKLVWVKLKGMATTEIRTFKKLCEALQIPVGNDSAARVLQRASVSK